MGAVRGGDSHRLSEAPIGVPVDLKRGLLHPPGPVWIGDVVAERFVVERPIGSGGMGSVFLAKDRLEGRPVAVKVLDVSSEGAVERFRREAGVLSELFHPGIVRYIAHGETAEREPFLAMELLEGEDLGQRLARSALSVEESLAVVRRATEALAFAHGRGIIHRDVKPSNLFLVNGDVERVKVLDFGIARARLHTRGLTQTGALLGTVGYMAPEQATGSRDVDARADVFALGCVLFECLAGRPAFAGEHVVAVLAKVLTEEAPRMSEVRPGLGSAIDSLLARMLAKRPEHRLEDARAVMSALDTLSSSIGPGSVEMALRPASLAQREQKVVSAILTESASDMSSSDTITMEEHNRQTARVHEITGRFGGEFTSVQGETGICLFSGKGTAVDQAARAASCALALRHELPELRIAVATGRAETGQRLPVGRAIDAAATLLRDQGAQSAPIPAEGVPIDELTAGFLAHRFELGQHDSIRVLLRERLGTESPRVLMGKPTPTVGREKELGLLELTLDECVTDRVARAVLVTGPPGIGKSRLLAEFVERVRARDAARLLVARAEAVSAGTPLGIAEKLVREATRLSEVSPAEAHARLREYLAQRVTSDKLARLAEFLGEIAGAPTDAVPSGLLRAARSDPTVMREQKRRAFEAWIDAETSSGALAIVVEDLHWADVPSVAYLDDALQRFSDRPLMALALGRPEVHDQFPRLWAKAGVQEIRLGGLTRRAAERLVRCVLGEAVSSEIASGLIDRADGNAFYLEELIRFAAEGRQDFPDTVVAMAQSRLEHLEPEARQVLRAASVAGDAAWPGCVTSLTGSTVDANAWLEVLADQEVLVRAPASRFSGEREYSFRHSLLRDAAYAMLTEADRSTAHRATGEWLERAGEQDARMLADHFEKGGDVDRAVHWIARAVRASLEAGDLAVEAMASHGIELGASGEALGVLLVGQFLTLGWGNQFDALLPNMVKCISLLPEDSPLWWLSAAGLLLAAGVLGRPEAAMPVVQKVFAMTPSSDANGHYGFAVQGLVSGLGFLGDTTSARALLEKFDALDLEHPSADPVFLAMLSSARNIVALMSPSPTSGLWDLELAWQSATRGMQLAEEVGHPVAVTGLLFWLGATERELGRDTEAEAAFSRSIERSSAIGADWIREGAEVHLAAVCAGAHADRAREVYRRAHVARDIQLAASSWVFSSELHLTESRLDDALADARQALATAVPVTHRWAAVTMARVELALGRPRAALETIAMALSSTVPMQAHVDAWLHLVRAEALHALGEVAAAHDTIRVARTRIQETAAVLTRPDLRDSFLSRVEPNRRTLELARQWLGDPGTPVGAS